jgi:hypothetical protein
MTRAFSLNAANRRIVCSYAEITISLLKNQPQTLLALVHLQFSLIVGLFKLEIIGIELTKTFRQA